MNPVQLLHVGDGLHAVLVPAFQDRIRVGKLRLADLQDRALARQENDIRRKRVLREPAVHEFRLDLRRGVILDAEGAEDREVLLPHGRALPPCLLHAADALLRPVLRDLLDVMEARMVPGNAVFQQILDQIDIHSQVIQEIDQRALLRLRQRTAQIILCNKKKPADVLLRGPGCRAELHDLGAGIPAVVSGEFSDALCAGSTGCGQTRSRCAGGRQTRVRGTVFIFHREHVHPLPVAHCAPDIRFGIVKSVRDLRDRDVSPPVLGTAEQIQIDFDEIPARSGHELIDKCVLNHRHAAIFRQMNQHENTVLPTHGIPLISL